MKNGHVYLTEDQHYYSVPYELIGKKLKMQYSRSQVNLYLHYELIATHKNCVVLIIIQPYLNICPHSTAMLWNGILIFLWRRQSKLILLLNITSARCWQRNSIRSKDINPVWVFYLLPNASETSGLLRLVKEPMRSAIIIIRSLRTYLQKIWILMMKTIWNHQTCPHHDNIRGGNYYQ